MNLKELVTARSISTHTPLAGRDKKKPIGYYQAGNFNSHAPCGARLKGYKAVEKKRKISTHTPLAGRDEIVENVQSFDRRFQLTRPLRGATYTQSGKVFIARDFNSHAPCGARRNGENHQRG